MFRDDKVLKLGFAVQEDLRRLAKCHPASFGNVRNVADLQSLVETSGVKGANDERDS